MRHFDKGNEANQPAFNSEEEMWAYIEEQDDILTQLEDAFAKPKAHEGIPESPTPFSETLRLATEGDPISQFNLSIAYTRGDGVSQDSEKAGHWLLRSAGNGFAPAQHNVGCYWQDSGDREGLRVVHESRKAELWASTVPSRISVRQRW